MRNAIVTGGSGFIGSWLILELLQNNVDVTAVVRDQSKLIPEIKNNVKCSVIEKAIDDLTGNEFDKFKSFDVFYHLGWSGVSPEYKNELKLQLNNISMSLTALEICNRIGCKKFIASGTVAEYVFCNDVMDVYAKQTPNDMYGAAKVSTHYFLEVRARQINQPFIWTVIPSTFGERRNGNNIITYTIKSLLKGERPQYGSLEQMWDFLYVSEVARALRLIGEKGKVNKIYGIGSGNYKPLKDYIEKIRDLINPMIELGIGELPSMSEQTFSSCVNIYDLIKDTGFIPRIDFESGIVKTIEWFKENGLK